MTFRPPATKQQRRRSRQGSVRRNLYMNIAFGLATVASVALLGGVLLGNYYADHWAPISSVNGAGISKDAVRDRAAVNKARYDRQIQDYQVLRNQGSITTDEYGTITSAISGHETASTLYQEALNQLQGDLVVEQYADKNGIRVSDADVDAQLTKDAGIDEMRRVKVISVDAKPTAPATVPTADEIAAAKAQAEKYLAELKSGTAWDDVYKESTAGGTAGTEGTNTGDLGLVTREQLALDAGTANAVFALAKEGDYSDVILGDDGMFRIATVSKIVAPYKDSGWADAVNKASSGGAYRSALRAEAIRQAVQKSIEDKYVTGSTVQRQVQEIAVTPGYGGTGEEYKFKIMLFAPNHDTNTAAQLDAADPAWTEAKKRADAAWAQVQQDPTKFASLAKDTTNNEEPYFSAYGGDAPWMSADVIYDYGQGGTTINMPALRSAVTAAGVQPGLLPVFQEPGMGYVVALLQGTRPSPADRMASAQLLMSLGQMDFDQAVAKYSESWDATKNGLLGWVTRYQLPTEMEQAIFSTPVGGVSRTIQTSSGYWVFKILAEQTRTPDATDQAKLKAGLFTTWLSQQTSAANIWTDSAALTAITPAA